MKLKIITFTFLRKFIGRVKNTCCAFTLLNQALKGNCPKHYKNILKTISVNVKSKCTMFLLPHCYSLGEQLISQSTKKKLFPHSKLTVNRGVIKTFVTEVIKVNRDKPLLQMLSRVGPSWSLSDFPGSAMVWEIPN